MIKYEYIKLSIRPKIDELRTSLYLLSKNKLTLSAMIILLIIILLAVFAPIIGFSHEQVYSNVNPADRLLPPSIDYLFGTDELGRDIFSRVIYGTRISISTSLITVGLAMLIGIPLGAIAGTIGKSVDEIIMRITDIFLSFPPLLLAIAISAFLGPSMNNALLAIVISWWPWYARIVRGQAVSLRERQFVKASRATGNSTIKIIFGHIVPNCIAPIIVQASLDLGGVIITMSSLSFLGLGAQSPTPEWGLMVSTSRNYFLNAWWYCFFPGVAIFITVLAFNLLGDGLREILDPKTRKR